MLQTKTVQDGANYLQGAGITSMSLKLSGVVSDNAVFTNHIMAAVMNNTHVVLKIESGLGDVWQGTFAVPSCERSGEYNKEETFSASFERFLICCIVTGKQIGRAHV